MRFLAILTAAFIGMTAFMGCNDREDAENHEDSDRLFSELRTLLETYCDSMEHAKDSVTIARLKENFEAAHLKINMQAPPMTDMNMTEGQNDTLAMLTEKWLMLKNNKPLVPDTVENADSLMQNADSLNNIKVH